MLASLVQGSAPVLAFLCICLALALLFEFSNGFHDTANAVATVIYTNSLRPVTAVVWSGIMNFAGVIIGGIAVAYALVELIPPDVLSPPDGGLAAGMLAALFISALIWNIGTWYFGIPNSSSHALIGALIGIALEDTLVHGKGLRSGIDWHQIWSVLSSLLVSPLLGFALALVLFRLVKLTVHDRRIFEPPEKDQPPVWWMRAILVTTCTGVSFAHGTNDGQKSIGLIMLTIIGLAPSLYALNRDMLPEQLTALTQNLPKVAQMLPASESYADARGAASALQMRLRGVQRMADIPADKRPAVRSDLNHLVAGLKTLSSDKSAPTADQKAAKEAHDRIRTAVDYAPWWVRILSATVLGIGTMVGYRRIVRTLGERLGKQHLVPAQGASAELVAAALIGTAGLTGYPVSTTHVVTGGIAGTMVGSGAGVQPATVWQIAAAWVLTLPATIALSAGLFYLFS
jgi:inorganic phosphate transporter, PiT family